MDAQMQQRSTELDRFCPPLPAPDMMQHGRRAPAGCAQPLLPCNGCSRYQAALNTPQLMWKCCWAQYSLLKEKNQHFLYCFACRGRFMVPIFHCSTHQYAKATRPFKLQPPHLCSQVSLRMYGRPERRRCCIEKCHAREKKFHEGRLLRRGILAHKLNKLLDIHSKMQVAAAAGTQHWGEEEEKGTRGLIETPEDWIQRT